MIWEIRKSFFNKYFFISIGFIFALEAAMVFLPVETGTEIITTNIKTGELIKDSRSKQVIGQIKFDDKIKRMRPNPEVLNVLMHNIYEEKMAGLIDQTYHNVVFFQVFNQRIAGKSVSIIIVIVIILLICRMSTMEVEAYTFDLIMATKSKYAIQYKKLFLSLLIIICSYLVVLCGAFVITAIQYGMPVNGHLSAIRILDMPLFLNGHYSIVSFILSKIITMFALYITFAVIGFLFSVLSKKTITAVLLTVLFIMFGKIIALFNFLPQNIITVFNFNNYYNIISDPDSHVLSSFFIGGNDIFFAGKILIIYGFFLSFIVTIFRIQKGEC